MTDFPCSFSPLSTWNLISFFLAVVSVVLSIDSQRRLQKAIDFRESAIEDLEHAARLLAEVAKRSQKELTHEPL
jgi:hypothetical protein